MRLATLARRSVAAVAATALVTATGVATGGLAGVASAQEVFSVSKSPNGLAQAVNNEKTATFVIYGSAFYPSGQQDVVLRPAFPATGQGDITGIVADNADACATPLPDADCGNTLTFSADLTIAAPGKYDVIVTQTSQVKLPPVDPEVDTCHQCVTVLSLGSAVTTGSAKYNAGTAPTDGKLTLTGSNFAKGARVDFFKTDADGNATVPDPAISFTPAVDGVSGYVDNKTLRGVYTAGSGFVAGKHVVRVTNIDDPLTAGPGAPFVQPRIIGLNPSALGQGAVAAPVAISGDGFDGNSTVEVATVAAGDVVLAGAPVATTDAKTLTVPLSVSQTSAAGNRNVTVRGTGGAFTLATGALAINPGPKFASNAVSHSSRGQGSTVEGTVSGSGFNTGTVFDFGDGVTVTTKPTTTATLAQVTIVVAPEAAIGARTIRATNGDKGTSTLANGFTVVARPVITKVTPPAGDRGTTTNVRLDGNGFATTGGVTLTLSGSGVTPGGVTVVDAGHLETQFTIAGGAAFGTRDITVTNNSTGGTSTCIACFGVNALKVTPSGATNSGPKTITVTGDGFTNTTTIRILLPGNPDYQAPIGGTSPSFNTTTGAVTATVDLTNVATGSYNVEASTAGAVVTCSGCFAVGATASPVVDTVVPATGGQGAVDRAVTITGSNFSPGETVTFSGTGVHATRVAYVSPTQITALVTVDPTAAIGSRTVTVSNIGDGRAGSKATAFNVNAAPLTTSIAPNQVGQGAVTDITLTGTAYAAGAVADFGQGISSVTKSVNAAGTQLVATITVAGTADTVALRSVKVTNADGGTQTLASVLRVTPAPIVDLVEPDVAKAGDTKAVTFTGTGFASKTNDATPPVTTFPTIIIAGATVTVTSVSEDGNTLTADLTVKTDSSASPGKRTVFITNPDEGKSALAEGFTIATVPAAPINPAATPGNATATVTWDVPASSEDVDSTGGTPLTGFVVSDGKADGDTGNVPDQTLAPDARTATFTGLTNGLPYTFSIKAINAVGASGAATKAATPFGKPLAPTGVVAAAGDAAATVLVTTSSNDSQGRPITAFKITTLPGGATKTVTKGAGSTTAIPVTGLTNGTSYMFQVSATNLTDTTDASGYGPVRTSNAVTPKFATTLTSTRSPRTGTAGQPVTYSGKLTRTKSGTPISGASVVVTLTPDVGGARSVAATTSSSGVWSFGFSPRYNTTVRAGWAGDADDSAKTAAAYRMGVAAGVSISVPSSSASSSTLVVKGSVSPNKADRTVTLNRVVGGKLEFLASTKVASDGSYSFRVKPVRGTYALRVTIAASPGNTAGSSKSVTTRRT